jgi:hypothetical protein
LVDIAPGVPELFPNIYIYIYAQTSIFIDIDYEIMRVNEIIKWKGEQSASLLDESIPALKFSMTTRRKAKKRPSVISIP